MPRIPCRDGEPARRRRRPDAYNIRDDQAPNAEQELLAAERHAALREAFTSLPPRYQQLITLLLHDPPIPYSQISAQRDRFMSKSE